MKTKEIKDKGAREQVEAILDTFNAFGAPMELVEVNNGRHELCVYTRTLKPTKMSDIAKFQKDLMYSLGKEDIRIEAPVPDKKLIGIFIADAKPSDINPELVKTSKEFIDSKGCLLVPLGVTEFNEPVIADIAKFPHLVAAGTTGSGKSVLVHHIITSLLKKYPPNRLRLLLIDSKRIELNMYQDIAHLLTETITDSKKAILALRWAAKEMDRRYDALQDNKVRDIASYHEEIYDSAVKKNPNSKNLPESMPYILIVIDEVSDIASEYPREFEASIVRLAQMSRAVGIHILITTSRPSTQVLTGLVKANMPTRIAFKTSSMIESRIILDQSGAEKLLGAGDALYMRHDMSRPIRIQIPNVKTADVKALVKTIEKKYNFDTKNKISGELESEKIYLPHVSIEEEEDNDELDEMFDEVKDLLIKEKKASTSLIQRRFKIGYGRAARIMDQLETEGVISPSDGTNRPRAVVIKKEKK